MSSRYQSTALIVCDLARKMVQIWGFSAPVFRFIVVLEDTLKKSWLSFRNRERRRTKTGTNHNPDPNRYRIRCPDPIARI